MSKEVLALCLGFSGTGKTHVCAELAASASLIKKVLYIDLENGYSVFEKVVSQAKEKNLSNISMHHFETTTEDAFSNLGDYYVNLSSSMGKRSASHTKMVSAPVEASKTLYPAAKFLFDILAKNNNKDTLVIIDSLTKLMEELKMDRAQGGALEISDYSMFDNMQNKIFADILPKLVCDVVAIIHVNNQKAKDGSILGESLALAAPKNSDNIPRNFIDVFSTQTEIKGTTISRSWKTRRKLENGTTSVRVGKLPDTRECTDPLFNYFYPKGGEPEKKEAKT